MDKEKPDWDRSDIQTFSRVAVGEVIAPLKKVGRPKKQIEQQEINVETVTPAQPSLEEMTKKYLNLLKENNKLLFANIQLEKEKTKLFEENLRLLIAIEKVKKSLP